MGRTICLVTYELAPVNRGGAGVLISALAEALALAGNRVHVLADIPESEVEEYRRFLRERGVGGIAAHALASIVPEAPHASTIFQAKSAHFRAGIYTLAEKVRFDLVEFFEYAGAAFDTLALRTHDDVLASSVVAVRIHGSLGMIDHAEGVQPVGLDRHAMYRMEAWAMRLADVVIAPLRSIAHQYQQIYGLRSDRLVICPPPMEMLLAELGRPGERTLESEQVLFYGKLQKVKGCEVFVDASVILAAGRPSLRFLMVGADTNGGPGGKSMQQHLLSRIPESIRDRFQFVSHIPRTQLPSVAASAYCAVVPSRSESFCLAAHELLRVGCPLILSDIAAFSDAFPDRERCLKFDGSAESLAACVERLFLDPELAQRLAASGRDVRYPDTAGAYSAMPSEVRTPQWESADFARREVAALGEWAARTERLYETERQIRDSPFWKLVRTADMLREHARDPMRGLVEFIRADT
jgi:glycosyltransferase involved in cell wall biosynthesis